MFLAVSETYSDCSSNNSKIYSVSGKLFSKSFSKVLNIPTIENPIIISKKYNQKIQAHVLVYKHLVIFFHYLGFQMTDLLPFQYCQFLFL